MRTLKKTIVTVITVALLLSLAGITSVFAATGSEGDFDWEDTAEDAVTITAYTGGGGSVTIPTTLSGKTVTAIADTAFKYADGVVEHAADVTDIIIQAPIELIPADMFSECTKLESVTFDGTSITEIGDNAFSGTALASIKVPAGSTSVGIEGLSMLTTIGNGAFSGTKLTSVRIPKSVTTIGDSAFSNCADLASLTFASEDNLISIGNNAFSGTKLVNISLPKSILTIGDYAFAPCPTLAKVVINNDAEIGAGAFRYSLSLFIYAPRGSNADVFCATARIFYVALETMVGDTSITSVVSSGSTRVTIKWSAAERATGYQVWRASTAGGSYSLIATTAGDVLSYTDTGLTVSATYYYKVGGIITEGEDTYYGNCSVPVAATPMPGAPNSVYAVSAAYDSINLSWTPVPSASGYEIWRANDTIDAAYSLIKTLPKSTTILAVKPNTYKFTGLTSGRKYFYKIRAYINVANPAGGTPTKCYGAYSGVTMARPIPVGVTGLKAVQTGPKVIKITWNRVAGASRYQIWRQGPDDEGLVLYPYTASTNYFINDINIVANSEYSYQVRAYRSSTTYGDIGENGKICGAKSDIATVNLADYQVTGVVAKRYSNTQINVTWSGITGVSGYEIQCAESEDGLADDFDPAPVDRKTYKYYYHKLLTDNTEYFYRVRAYRKVTVSVEYPDGKIYGAWSAIVKAKT